MAKTKTLCRVHWLLHHLNRDFKRIYTLKFDYSKHCYFFYRLKGRSILDSFIIVRTSKHCFRVSYFNTVTLNAQAFTVPRSINVARRMWLIYLENSIIATKINPVGDRNNIS